MKDEFCLVFQYNGFVTPSSPKHWEMIPSKENLSDPLAQPKVKGTVLSQLFD
jgi:hypothetical protein